jgi:outer membrane receptor protein involved in Fe transport
LAINGYEPILPNFSFGSAPSNAMSCSRNGSTAGTHQNANPIWTYQDNLSKASGHHAFKAGIYVEHNEKYQPKGNNYMGSFSFASSTSTPQLNTNDGFANALLGNVNSYSQWTGTTTFDVKYWNVEFYAQDNWKVNRRLTLDLGLRRIEF